MTIQHFGKWTYVLSGIFIGLHVLFAFSAIAHQTPASMHWTPTTQQISDVEARLTLPEGSKPLAVYARYYSGQIVLGHHMLVGEFVLGDEEPGVRVVNPGKAPKILDGGCSVVNLNYDVEKRKVVEIFCNGVG